MARAKFSVGLLAVLLCAGALPTLAQLSPSEPDPLARIRDAAKANVPACSATGESLCEQVAPKIVANAEGDSPLAGNLHRLTEGVKNQTRKTSDERAAFAWAIEAFRDANVEVHTEKYDPSVNVSKRDPRSWETVVAEIPGREKPDEWVLLGAHLDPSAPSLNQAYNAALVIEAARDIRLTGIRPRRSIRFVLFCTGEQRMTGAWIYLRMHRDELHHATGVMIFSAAAHPVTGFTLNGRHDIESGVREALEPIYAMGVTHHSFDASLEKYGLDFILEGIPTLVAPSRDAENRLVDPLAASSIETFDIQALKRNTAIAAVTVFGIAERAEPIGPRQSRAEIERLLKTTGLEEQMKTSGLWPLWESGERGRLP
ncbi:MAG TPA: M28 family peptidase [Candidatus Acidoferrales bacterium]|jgi:acetylornithine deacetylase/succinyl-diaminopimelate desuccinylase-like protein|nr:M28 family peptidase [Candidatus Acidoferrales bacterium]